MKRSLYALFSLFVLAGLLLAACGGCCLGAAEPRARRSLPRKPLTARRTHRCSRYSDCHLRW